MTVQESFKKRIRVRMAATGERYVEARRVLLASPGSSTSKRRWVSAPEMSDEAIRKGTGKGWDEWCDLIDQFENKADGHTAIANHVRDDLGVGAWKFYSGDWLAAIDEAQ